MKIFFKRALIIFLCMLTFGTISYIYLNNIKIEEQSSSPNSSVPYSSVPRNAFLIFEFENGSLLAQLDFEKKSLIITNAYEESEIWDNSFNVKVNEALIAGMIDRVGGIELFSEGQLMRFTGSQIIDMLKNSQHPKSLSLSILEEYLKKLSVSNITRQDLVYLIENSDTNLSIPDCFYWHEYINALCENYIVNII